MHSGAGSGRSVIDHTSSPTASENRIAGSCRSRDPSRGAESSTDAGLEDGENAQKFPAITPGRRSRKGRRHRGQGTWNSMGRHKLVLSSAAPAALAHPGRVLKRDLHRPQPSCSVSTSPPTGRPLGHPLSASVERFSTIPRPSQDVHGPGMQHLSKGDLPSGRAKVVERNRQRSHGQGGRRQAATDSPGRPGLSLSETPRSLSQERDLA
jgi:hypothetical protein